MPKWVSKTGPTHLYPDSSVVRTGEKMGRAEGPAYCGKAGGSERVFFPNDRAVTFDWFESDGWVRPCSECTALVEDRRLTDPDWQRCFREEYVNG